MFDFGQYLGFVSFVVILLIGFWLLIFLATFVVPYWIGGAFIEMMKEKKANKKLQNTK